MSTLSVATSPRCTIAKMSSRRAPPARLIGCLRFAVRRRKARASATVRAVFSSGATRSSSPASGTSSSPSTSTGTDGPASTIDSPRSSNSARTLPHAPPATIGSPTRSVPLSTSAVTTGPRPGSRFDSSTSARAGAFGFAVELLELGDQQQRLEQLVDTLTGGRGDVEDDRVAAPGLGYEPLLDELLAHARRVGVVTVDLGDRHDDRHVGGPRVADRLHRLGHHAVVGGDDEHRDVGRTRAACTHGGERLVARRVDERDRVAVVDGLVRADVLGDAARLARDDVGVADVVEQRGLAVVDVAHHGDDRRARLEQRFVELVVVAEHRLQLELGLLARLDEQHLGAERLGDEVDHLVGERLRAGDHLARVEEQAHEVGRGAVQLGRELLDGAAPLDDDLALGHRRVERRELRERRGTEILEVATTTLLAPGPLTLGAGTTSAASGATGTSAARTTSATSRTAGTAPTGTPRTRAPKPPPPRPPGR